MKTFQFFSDLHIERIDDLQSFFNQYLQPHADNIVLLGDIFNISDEKKVFEIFSYCSKNWEKVFFICGNHEYFYGNISELDQKLKNIIDKFENIIWLNNSGYDLSENLRIIGGCMWSYIDEDKSKYIEEKISTYKHVKNLTVEHTNSYFLDFIEFLDQEMKQNKYFIICTHFAPLPLHTQSEYHYLKGLQDYSSQAFVNDMSEYLNNKIIFWGFGHTHHSTNFLYGNNKTRIYSNPFGYEHENIVRNSFQSNEIIEFDETEEFLNIAKI